MTAIPSKLLLLSLLGVLVVLVVIGTLRIERSMWITRMINKLADTSAQIRIRLSMALVVGLGALATHLGFEPILGAFIVLCRIFLDGHGCRASRSGGCGTQPPQDGGKGTQPPYRPPPAVTSDACEALSSRDLRQSLHRRGDPSPGGPGCRTQAPAVPPRNSMPSAMDSSSRSSCHQRPHVQPVGAVLERLYLAAGAALPAGPPGRARTARRPLPVRPSQHPRCRRRGAAPGDVAALHRRCHHHRTSGARHQAGQRGCTHRRRAFQRHPFPDQLAAVAAIVG